MLLLVLDTDLQDCFEIVRQSRAIAEQSHDLSIDMATIIPNFVDRRSSYQSALMPWKLFTDRVVIRVEEKLKVVVVRSVIRQ